MQIQMEVCELSECDFLETRFIEYEDYTEFANDGSFTHTSQGKPKGIMMLFIDTEGSPIYKYLEIGANEEKYTKWNSELMIEMSGKATWLKTIYWKMDEVSVVLVKRNKKWFQSAEPILNKLWTTIEHEREYGYEHRAPRKKQRLLKDTTIAEGICLIKLDGDEPMIEQQKNDKKDDKNVVIMDIDTETLDNANQSLDI